MHHCEWLVSFPAHDDPSSVQYFGDEYRTEPRELQLRSTGCLASIPALQLDIPASGLYRRSHVLMQRRCLQMRGTSSSHSCFVSWHAAFRHRPSVLKLRSMNPSLLGWYGVVLILCIQNSRHTSSTTFHPKIVPWSLCSSRNAPYRATIL